VPFHGSGRPACRPLASAARRPVLAAPIVGAAVAARWWGARALPPDWAAGRGRLALLLGGAGAFGAAGVGRRLLAEHGAAAGGATGFLPGVLPYAVLGAAAGACLAEVRAVSGSAR
jgi:hypothetical protein